jgi:dUTP pyrophosphatase
MGEVLVKVCRVGNRGAPLPLPAYMSGGASGLDLRADAEFSLAQGGRALVPTGLSLAIPAGFEAQVRPRSGLAVNHGVTVLNAPGTIDSDFRGEVHVLLVNLSAEPFQAPRGARIAQLVVARVARADLHEAPSLESTARGEGGFGSTGG